MNTLLFKKRLLARRETLMGDVRQIERKETEGAGATPEADLGMARVATEVSVGCLETATHEVQLIDAALNRIEAGTYGFCTGCGVKIPVQRLEAIPYAKFCLACQKIEELS